MKHLLSLVMAAFLPGLFHGAAAETLDLSGRWTVALDSLNRGMAEGYTSTDFADAINLPGTTDMAGLGTPNAHAPSNSTHSLQPPLSALCRLSGWSTTSSTTAISAL